MAIKRANYGAEPGVFKRLWRSNWSNDHIQKKLKYTIDSNDNGGDDYGFGKEMEECIEMTPAIFKQILGTRLSNASKPLESGDVGFGLTLLEFMESMNQKLKCGK